MKVAVIVLPVLVGLLVYFAWQTGHLDAAKKNSAFGSRLLLLATGFVFWRGGRAFLPCNCRGPAKIFFLGLYSRSGAVPGRSFRDHSCLILPGGECPRRA